jgi:hypothetical protein
MDFDDSPIFRKKVVRLGGDLGESWCSTSPIDWASFVRVVELGYTLDTFVNSSQARDYKMPYL